MKIADELLILTREHHLSLSLSNKALNTAKTQNTQEIQTLCSKISKVFRGDFQAHFETEELTIFTPLENKSTMLKPLCEKLTKEHQKLCQLAEQLKDKPELLAEFGALLKNHSRVEDRELFPNINLLSETERHAIKTSSEKHLPITRV